MSAGFFFFFTNWQLQESQRDFTCNQPRGSQVWDTREKRANLKNTLNINFYWAVSSHTHDNSTKPKKEWLLHFHSMCALKGQGSFKSYPYHSTNPRKDKSYSFICCRAAFILLLSSLKLLPSSPFQHVINNSALKKQFKVILMTPCIQSFHPSKAV